MINIENGEKYQRKFLGKNLVMVNEKTGTVITHFVSADFGQTAFKFLDETEVDLPMNYFKKYNKNNPPKFVRYNNVKKWTIYSV